MRFYVMGKDDPHGTHVALYIGNLPTSLNQKQYEQILNGICSRDGEVSRKSLALLFCHFNLKACSHRWPCARVCAPAISLRDVFHFGCDTHFVHKVLEKSQVWVGLNLHRILLF